VIARLALQPALEADALQREHFGDAFVAEDDWWTRAVDRTNARRVRRRLAGRLSPGGRILEIGPGRGAMLAELAESGYAAEGLELSAAVAKTVGARSGGTVRVGSIETLASTVGRETYDGVIARHVLEHISDPVRALAVIFDILRPQGVLYIAVPNVAAPEAMLSGWTGYQPYHLHYFRPATLHGLLRRAGFVVVEARTREPFSGWVNAIVNSVRGGGSSSGQSGPSLRAVAGTYNLARLAIGGALWPLRTLQARIGCGEEIEVVAQKPSTP
jgi:SAM-dependent methyltransferase